MSGSKDETEAGRPDPGPGRKRGADRTTVSRRWRRRSHRRPAPGAAPGTLSIDPNAPRPVLSVVAYGPDEFVEKRIHRPEEIKGYVEKWPVTWIDVHGLGDEKTILALGDILGLHRLALGDVVHVGQRTKIEAYPDRLFMVMRTATFREALETEQLSLFIGGKFVISFQETSDDPFDPVRERIREGGQRLRGSGPDYLAYALIDTVVDHYFPLLEGFGERLDALQEEVIERPERHVAAEIHTMRRDLLTLRRAVWPLREATQSLLREANPLITDETRVYLRDCYDHVVQIMDILESCREVASGLMDVYLSSVSNRMNEVMKVLTIFAAIFIPLTFIAGIYGMNFSTEISPWNMPELNWRWGYPLALGSMAAVAVGMLMYFKRKGWF